jgi:hypothetical protein
MKCTTAITRHIATAAMRCSWAILSAAERLRAKAERMEDWAYRLARWGGCVDDMLATLTNEALSSS